MNDPSETGGPLPKWSKAVSNVQEHGEVRDCVRKCTVRSGSAGQSTGQEPDGEDRLEQETRVNTGRLE